MDLSQYSTRSFDRGASRLKEGLWHLMKIVFFQNPLPMPSRLRVTLLRLFGARVGKRVVIRANVNITFPWRLVMRDHVWIGEEVTILSLAPVAVGSNVCISQRAYLCTGSHEYRADTFDLVTRPITVESETWIAAQAFIGPGVTVGRGSVVSAGSVVLRDVPAGAVVRGNPATLVEGGVRSKM
jgi:putative colanic acid biosynthesis acetyltransferase WcaF